MTIATGQRVSLGFFCVVAVTLFVYLTVRRQDICVRDTGSALSIPKRLYGHNGIYGVKDGRGPLTIESIKTHVMGKGPNNTTLYLEFDSKDESLVTLLNAHCQDKYTVPPIAHYVWFDKTTMEIHEYISVLSMSKFVKPCYILFHGNRVPGGRWWDLLLTQVHNIIHVQIEAPRQIFGRAINVVEHKADVLRLQILIKYGGIYSDTDLYALRSFDELRKFPFTLGREDGRAVANGIILANKDAAFLKLWMITYHTFNDQTWGGNSVMMAHKLCGLVPSLVHLERNSMVMLGTRYQSVYEENLTWDNSQYSVHLYARFFKKRNYEIEELKHLDSTYGALSRYVLFGTRDLIPR